MSDTLDRQTKQLRLAQARAEIAKLKTLPTPLQCPLAVSLLEKLMTDLDIEVADDDLQLLRVESPRHSWLRVPKDEIARLKLTNRVSRFSYLDDKHYYLETSHDMRLFLDARYSEGREVAGWDDLAVRSFPHIAGISRLDQLPGYVSMA